MFRVIALGYRAGMIVDRLRAKKNFDDIRFVYCNTDSSLLHVYREALWMFTYMPSIPSLSEANSSRRQQSSIRDT